MNLYIKIVHVFFFLNYSSTFAQQYQIVISTDQLRSLALRYSAKRWKKKNIRKFFATHLRKMKFFANEKLERKSLKFGVII